MVLLKKMVDYLIAHIANHLLTLLRNRKNLDLTREEFRTSNISFSQFGEDLLVLTYFPDSYKGFYVDVGAFHPFKLSNTMLLYKLGWQGLNIDCDQEKIDEFVKLRPRDKNVCAALANCNKQMTLLRYPMSATNRLSVNSDDSEENLSLCQETPIDSSTVVTKTLDQVLKEVNLADKVIDFLDIDVEGIELEVLEGLNFKQSSPKLISVEIMNSKKRELITEFLGNKGYVISSIVRHNFFFKRVG